MLQKDFNKCSIIDTVKRTYTVTGIIERPKTSELYDPSNLSMIYTVSDEKAPIEAIRTKHMNKLYIAYTPQSEGNYLQNTADILGFKADDMSNVISDEISPEDQQTSGINAYEFNSILLSMKGYGSNDATNTVIFNLAVIIIIIVMLASVFVIRNSFAISITEKTSMYGMLASVGATKRQIRRNVLFEGFILGLIGIPLGILLGLGVNAVLGQKLDILRQHVLGQRRGRVLEVFKSALFGLCDPRLVIAVAAEKDAAVLLERALYKLVQSRSKVRCFFKLVGENAQRVCNDRVQNRRRAGYGLARAGHAELEFVAGEGNGRGTVAVGGVARNGRQNVNADAQRALALFGVARVVYD